MKSKKRIHPVVVATAILALAAMALMAKAVTGEDLLEFELVIAALIGALAGVKLRMKLPVT